MQSSLTLARAIFSRAQLPMKDSETEGLTSPSKKGKEHPPKPNRWILNCPLDLLFVCGGLLWGMVIAAISLFLVSYQSAYSVLGVVTIGGALLFADSHNAATILRFIEEPGLAARHPYVSVLLPVFIGTCVLVSLLVSHTYLMWAVKLYLILIAQHVTAQAYGITLIYLRKQGMQLSMRHIIVIKVAFTAMMVAGIGRQFTYAGTRQLMGVDVPNMALLPDFINPAFAVIAVFASLVMLIVLTIHGINSKTGLHAGAVMVAGTTLVLSTVPPVLGLVGALSPAFFHGTQYIAVTTANAMRIRSASAAATDPAATMLASRIFTEANFCYWMKLLTVGAVLYLVIPLLITKLDFSPIVAMAAVFCTVNFHHFAADAAIWRSRNTKQQLIPQPIN